MSKKIKLYGCPECGSEFTKKQKDAITKRSKKYKEAFTCQFCTNTEPLEDLGDFDEKDLIPNLY